jgi:hypothetical protein
MVGLYPINGSGGFGKTPTFVPKREFDTNIKTKEKTINRRTNFFLEIFI